MPYWLVEETLIKIGLNQEEVEIYLDLLEHGAESASQVATHTSVKRTYVYKIMRDLASKGLVVEAKRGRATVFEPSSPDHLLTLAEAKKAEANQAQSSLENMLSALKGKYSSIEARPIINSHLGLAGLKKVYKDVLEQRYNILLLRSVYDDKRVDLNKTVMEQIKNQVKLGIKVRTITPLETGTKEVYLKHDEENMVKRHIVHEHKLDLPAQIIVYKQKAAIISLKKEIVSTIIDNRDISDTFRALFNFMWEKTKVEHEEIISKWKKV